MNTFYCCISVRGRGVINICEEVLTTNLQKLFTTDELLHFRIKVDDETCRHAPTVYFDKDIFDPLFFDTTVEYYSEEIYRPEDVGNIKRILEYFWGLNAPAATYCIEDDFEDQLPWKGGNDLDNVFWRDPEISPDK